MGLHRVIKGQEIRKKTRHGEEGAMCEKKIARTDFGAAQRRGRLVRGRVRSFEKCWGNVTELLRGLSPEEEPTPDTAFCGFTEHAESKIGGGTDSTEVKTQSEVRPNWDSKVKDEPKSNSTGTPVEKKRRVPSEGNARRPETLCHQEKRRQR